MLLYKMRKAATPSAALGADKAAAERKRQEEEQLRQEEADRKQLIIDLKRESYEGQLELAREAYDKEQRLLVGKHDMMTASEKRYNQSLNQLAQQRKANAAAVQGQLYSAMGGALSMFLGSQHALTKAAAVAEAVCNMNRGIALAAAYPPPLNAKVALAAKIQGATAIAGILATSFNSGGSGASGGGGGGTDLGTSATSSPVAASVGDLGQVATVVEPKERTAHDIQVHIHYAGTVVRENQLVDELVIPRLQQRIYDNVGLGA
jgi:hypothetical protein